MGVHVSSRPRLVADMPGFVRIVGVHVSSLREIETPTGMFDDGQVALMQSIVGKLLGAAAEERDRARQTLEAYLADPEVAGPICDRLAATKKQATPEAQALAIIMRGFSDD